jgi:two-component system sensor histidine kinase HydH
VTTSKTSLHWSRWAVVGTIAITGAVLLLTVWITYQGVRDASDALVRGQAAAIQADLRSEFRDFQGPPTREILESIVDSYREEGLHYIALVRRKTLIVDGGKTTLKKREVVRNVRTMRRAELEVRGNRVQLVLRAAGPRGRRGDPARPKGPAVYVEFEPREANALKASSTRSLATGAGTAVVLWLTALLLLRWFTRQDAARRQLEEARRLASLGQMSAVLAHEIRNPLASLKGNAQLLEKMVAQEAEPESKALSKAERVVSEANRLESLINDLLEFARSGELHRREEDPGKLLQGCAEALGSNSIAVDVSQAPATWSLDAGRISQVLNNLLQNALHASERVEASVSTRAGRLNFVVRDYGSGIAESEVESLFEPFHTKKTQGTGLGLSVAKRLVELHAGTISAKNAEGGGAEFRVEIPRNR